MATIKVKVIEKALGRKGFRTSQGHHRFHYLYHQDKKTCVYTKTSHGHREVGDTVIACMADQLHLSTGDFRRLVKCPMTKEEYLQNLASQNLI
jgi:hypothetical protein